MSATAGATGRWWLLALLAAGFAFRTVGGARRSIAGLIAVNIATRFRPAKFVPAPPKRFA